MQMTICLVVCPPPPPTARSFQNLPVGIQEEDGYYGGETPESESGEALTIVDRREAWIFHILPDDTGTSAIWAAQRVPDDRTLARHPPVSLPAARLPSAPGPYGPPWSL